MTDHSAYFQVIREEFGFEQVTRAPADEQEADAYERWDKLDPRVKVCTGNVVRYRSVELLQA